MTERKVNGLGRTVDLCCEGIKRDSREVGYLTSGERGSRHRKRDTDVRRQVGQFASVFALSFVTVSVGTLIQLSSGAYTLIIKPKLDALRGYIHGENF